MNWEVQCLEDDTATLYIAKVDPAPAHQARAPLFEIFKGLILKILDCRTRIDFILINMQCLQCVFCSLFSLQKQRVYEKGHQNNLQT